MTEDNEFHHQAVELYTKKTALCRARYNLTHQEIPDEVFAWIDNQIEQVDTLLIMIGMDPLDDIFDSRFDLTS